MFSKTKLFHAEVPGFPHMHIFARSSVLAGAQLLMYLRLRRDRGDHCSPDDEYIVKEARVHNMSRLQRAHLSAAIMMSPTGFGVYDPEQGWEVIDVFEFAEK